MSTCRGCGAVIVWGLTAEGKKVPLDPRAPVYELSPNETCARAPSRFLVTHFATCPKANDFSGSRKKAEPKA